MGATLVVTGEHYVSDLLLGVLYAFVVHRTWLRIEVWWEGRKDRPGTTTLPDDLVLEPALDPVLDPVLARPDRAFTEP